MLRRRSSLLDPMTNELTSLGASEVKSTIQDIQQIQKVLEDNHLILSSPDTLGGDMYAQPLIANKFISNAHDLMEQASMLLNKAQYLLKKAL
jgi:hypothetical protein